MRLFRRTLLCLVVGVTAFGAAGWMLRPRPDWELVIGERDQWFHFARREDTSDDNDPLWLYARNSTVRDGEGEPSDIVGLQSNGRLFHQSSRFIGDFDEPFVTNSGGFACRCAMSRNEEPFETIFMLIGRDGA